MQKTHWIYSNTICKLGIELSELDKEHLKKTFSNIIMVEN